MPNPLHLLLITLDAGGNLPPLFGLARQLARRGHHVRVLTEPCLEAAVQAQGFEFIAFQHYFTRTDRGEGIIRDGNASALANPVFENVVLGPAKTVVAQTLETIRQAPTDLVLVDVLLVPALIAAQALQVPGVVVFHMPEYMPGPNRPPGGLGVLPGNGWLSRVRDRFLGRVFHRVLNRYLPLLNEIRAGHALPKLRNVVDLMHEADLRLIQTLRSFDFPIEPAPPNVRYTGPVLDDPDWTDHWSNPWPEGDPRPLIVISFSSTFQNQGRAIQNAIDALRGLEVRGLVTLGPAIEPGAFTAPENVVIMKSASHAQVFPHADLVITHAGHGTLLRALAHGLPLICLPMGRDQKDNAALVAYHGCGIRLHPKAGPAKIREAVTRILRDGRFRQNAARFQQEILEVGQEDVAVTALEQLTAVHRRSLLTLEND